LADPELFRRICHRHTLNLFVVLYCRLKDI